LSNGPTIIEAQTDFICDTIAAMNVQGITTIEAKPEAEDEWKEGMNAMTKWVSQSASIPVNTDRW
jgi:hypothetical protein